MAKKASLDKVEELELEYEDITLEDRVEAIEKKSNIIIGLLIVLLVFSLITMIVSLNGKGSSSTDNTEAQAAEGSNTYDTSAFKEISASDIKSESKGQTIVVLLARQGCSYCAAFAPIITQVANDYGVTIRYLDYSKIVDVEKSSIADQKAYDTVAALKGSGDWADFAETALQGTPNTFFIKDNKIIYGINGYNDQSVVEDAFEAAGFSK